VINANPKWRNAMEANKTGIMFPLVSLIEQLHTIQNKSKEFGLRKDFSLFYGLFCRFWKRFGINCP